MRRKKSSFARTSASVSGTDKRMNATMTSVGAKADRLSPMGPSMPSSAGRGATWTVARPKPTRRHVKEAPAAAWLNFFNDSAASRHLIAGQGYREPSKRARESYLEGLRTDG